MTDEKTKVKDLATELHVAAKDVVQAMRDLDIPVRNASTLIGGDDLARIREHFRNAEGTDHKESQPGVIVRRRQRPAPQAGAAENDQKEQARSVSAAFAPASSGARIVSRPDDGTERPAETPESGDEPAGSDETAQTPAAQEAGEDRNRQPRDKSRKRLREATPVAKVISRPQDQAAAAAKAAEEAAAKAAEEAAAKAAEEARLKAEAEARAAAEKARQAERIEKTEKTDRPRKVQPAASARPEGSSAPSLLPPVPETPRASSDNEEEGEEGRHERRRKRQPEPASPQVRIISRPDPVAAAAPRSRDANVSSGNGRDNRRSGQRAERPDRSDRADRSERSERRSGGFQNQSRSGGYQAARSGASSGMPGGFNGGMPANPEREGQSKKKRNKGSRRGPDFQETSFMGRRHEEDDEMPRPRSVRRRPKARTATTPQATQPIKAAKRKIRIEESIRVADMAHQMGLKSNEIIKVLFNLGIMATINKALDIDTASVVASEFGYEVEKVGFAEEDYLAEVKTVDSPEQLKLRPPVVTIMGHVDHGKTSLLDAIRKTNVTSGEEGGSTQHSGAYHVKTKRGEIVFLDTPGHEAFTAMRARGAQVTDIVVLVVAADDGVMEQTREAINHSKAAGVPIMVAVNKMDKPTANPDRVLQELASLGLVPEEWGGDTVVCKVSAKTREGLDEMLEMLALQADILELKANPDKPARGHIVEAKLDKGRGPVATVLIQEGTLHQGDTFVCGVFSGRVRAMFNDQGRKVKEAGPSIPVEVQGFDGVPEAGEEFICLEDEKLARRIAESRAIKQREKELAKQSRVTLETFLSRKADDQEALTLNLVVKSDVQGSLEAIIDALHKQSTDKVRLNIIHGGTGAITESDILLASASDAIIIGFNVRPTAKVKEVADHENVDIRFYDIIYKLVDEIKSAMAGLLAPVSREVYLGQAEVREVFSVPKVGSIAGSHVTDGKITRSANVRLLRDGVVVHNGKVSSLRRFKDDVREVLKGYECGVGLENFNDIKVGDVIEAFEIVEEAATL